MATPSGCQRPPAAEPAAGATGYDLGGGRLVGRGSLGSERLASTGAGSSTTPPAGASHSASGSRPSHRGFDRRSADSSFLSPGSAAGWTPLTGPDIGRRQLDALEERLSEAIASLSRQHIADRQEADSLAEQAIGRLEARLSAMEQQQPRADRRVSELSGIVRGFGEEQQAQQRQAEQLQEKLRGFCASADQEEEEVRRRLQDLERDIQALQSSATADEGTQRRHAQRVRRLELQVEDHSRAMEHERRQALAALERVELLEARFVASAETASGQSKLSPFGPSSPACGECTPARGALVLDESPLVAESLLAVQDLEMAVNKELRIVHDRCNQFQDTIDDRILGQLRRVEQRVADHDRKVEQLLCDGQDCLSRVEEHEVRIGVARSKLDAQDHRVALLTDRLNSGLRSEKTDRSLANLVLAGSSEGLVPAEELRRLRDRVEGCERQLAAAPELRSPGASPAQAPVPASELAARLGECERSGEAARRDFAERLAELAQRAQAGFTDVRCRLEGITARLRQQEEKAGLSPSPALSEIHTRLGKLESRGYEHDSFAGGVTQSLALVQRGLSDVKSTIDHAVAERSEAVRKRTVGPAAARSEELRGVSDEVLARAERRSDEVERRVSTAEGLIARLTEGARTRDDAVGSAQQRLRELSLWVEPLQARVSDLEDRVCRSERTPPHAVTEQTSRLSRAETAVADLDRRLTALAPQPHGSDHATLERHLDQRLADLDRHLSSNHATLERRIDQELEDLRQSRRDQDQNMREQSRLLTELKDGRAQLDTLLPRLDRAESDIDSARRQHHYLPSEHADVVKRLERAERDSEQQQRTLRVHEEAMERSEATAQDLRSALGRQQSELDLLQDLRSACALQQSELDLLRLAVERQESGLQAAGLAPAHEGAAQPGGLRASPGADGGGGLPAQGAPVTRHHTENAEAGGGGPAQWNAEEAAGRGRGRAVRATTVAAVTTAAATMAAHEAAAAADAGGGAGAPGGGGPESSAGQPMSRGDGAGGPAATSTTSMRSRAAAGFVRRDGEASRTTKLNI